MQRLPNHVRDMLSTRNPSDQWCRKMPKDWADFIVIGSGHNAIHLTKSEFHMAVAAAIREWGASEVRKIVKEETEEDNRT